MSIYRFPVGLTWGGKGSPGVNVWHVRTTDPSIPGVDLGSAQVELDAASEAIRVFYNAVKGHLAEGLTIKSPPLVTEITGPTPAFDAVTTPWTISASGYKSAPAPVALTCTWYTENATRRGRGRTFLSPLATGAAAQDGTPDDATVSAIQGAAQILVNTSKAANGWAIGVYSDVDNVLRDITRVYVRDTFAVLRSRRD